MGEVCGLAAVVAQKRRTHANSSRHGKRATNCATPTRTGVLLRRLIRRRAPPLRPYPSHPSHAATLPGFPLARMSAPGESPANPSVEAASRAAETPWRPRAGFSATHLVSCGHHHERLTGMVDDTRDAWLCANENLLHGATTRKTMRRRIRGYRGGRVSI